MEQGAMKKSDELITSYQFAERLKAALILGSKLLLVLEALKGEELEGAKKLMFTFLDALDTEIGIAVNATDRREFRLIDEKVALLRTMLESDEIQAAFETLGAAVSQATTACANTRSAMAESGLI
jgi:hypothetical protein